MRANLAFNESQDKRFIVLCAIEPATPVIVTPSVFLFSSEHPFLENVVAAGLRDEDMISVTSTVLLSIVKPVFPQRWVTIEVTESQRVTLGLHPERAANADKPRFSTHPDTLPGAFGSLRQMHDFLLQAPFPFLMMKGPEHVLTFINPPYVELLHRDVRQNLLGLPVRELLPELEGQPFFGLLDEVYRTGVPFVGKEIFGSLRNQKTGEMKDHYFDFVYHPTHDESGAVSGIFAQAFDVTERVLARQVSASREAQLYRQWAELDTMYRTSPVGMCLLDVEEYRVLRMSDKLASLIGRSAGALIGQRILDIFPVVEGAAEQLRKAAAGEYVRNFEVATAVHSMPGVLRQWLVNFGPLRGASGAVEAIACVSLEITDRIPYGEEASREKALPFPLFSDAEG
ncbi:PAS domain-containing protein [Granulicella aggregans]|uniref:PAS domain-containing protein n=1 Tax=Granulicella aggregans TaxID=474949 RepID=UPI0021DFC9DF|nr:PAS domain-containing protein [Granulicella aggregans]